MEFLPTTLGTRPRLAVEVRAEGVVAARAEDAAAALTAVARANLFEGALAPGLKVGNIVDKAAVVAAVRKALDGVAGTGRERSRDVTLVVPDSAVRVLFLDFDQLPSKAAETLPVVRFRLKKLLPFDADDAMVSYQVMSNVKGSGIKMVAVAIPRDVLTEYEGIVLAAGFLPGAVLPSTLAALAGLEESDSAALVVNAGPGSVTTAIVQAGNLMLHRSVDMRNDVGGDMGSTLVVNADVPVAAVPAMSVVDREHSAQEWAQQEPQEPLGPAGWGRFDAATGMQSALVETAAVRERAAAGAAHEVTQAVSVAAAYFEDTLQMAPETVLSAGTLGAETLAVMMEEGGLAGLRVREMVDAGMLEAGAATTTVPRSWLAGVRGALRN
jgi:type IV pilus assembly protein PilM